MSNTIGLSKYIDKVKQDLLDSQYRHKDEVPMFAIQEVEIEMQVVATIESGISGKGGLKLSVPLVGEIGGEVGTEGKYNTEDTQTIRVKLQPLVTREEVLAKMSAEQLAKVQDIATTYIARGGDDEVTGDDRA